MVNEEKSHAMTLTLIIIKMDLFIEGRFISAKELFCLRTLFGATWMRLSDLSNFKYLGIASSH